MPCNDLLQSVLALGIRVVSHDDHDNGHEFVHQRERAVLQLPCQDPFRVHVGDFFDFLKGE